MQIRRLTITRYRGIKSLVWTPGPGLNCILGPGDVGKTTILDAIGTLLSPAPGRVASEYDYFEGDTATGYVIEALLGNLGDEMLRAWPVAPLWTWLAAEGKVQADPDPAGEAVLCARVRGTSDLEIEHTIVDPSDGELTLSASRRHLFGLSTMSPASTASSELRMSRGSLLSRNIDSTQLRALVTGAVKASRDGFVPPAEIQARLRELSKIRASVAPGTGTLSLGLFSPRGQSLLGMVGLFSQAGLVELPLTSAGLGTQQLTLFTLASALTTSTPLFVIDEIESGLEPFRQREIVERVRRSVTPNGQAFVTTHSPASIGAMTVDELNRAGRAADATATVSRFPAALRKIKHADPEALLCRIPVVVEGETELGLLGLVLERIVQREGTTLGALGVRLVDGGGQPHVFAALKALREMRLPCAAFLDSETKHRGLRQSLIDDPAVAFGTYSIGQGPEDALAQTLSIEALDALMMTPGPGGYDASDSRYQQLNTTAGAQSRKRLVDLAANHGDEHCRDLFARAAVKSKWFKSQHGGETVARFLLAHHPGSTILADIRGFWTSTRALIAADLPVDDSEDGPA